MRRKPSSAGPYGPLAKWTSLGFRVAKGLSVLEMGVQGLVVGVGLCLEVRVWG